MGDGYSLTRIEQQRGEESEEIDNRAKNERGNRKKNDSE
jgi:hypothetical protein